MFYALVDADSLRAKGIGYFRRMPDGRAIVKGSDLRYLGSFTHVEIVASEEELTNKIKEMEEKK